MKRFLQLMLQNPAKVFFIGAVALTGRLLQDGTLVNWWDLYHSRQLASQEIEHLEERRNSLRRQLGELRRVEDQTSDFAEIDLAREGEIIFTFSGQ